MTKSVTPLWIGGKVVDEGKRPRIYHVTALRDAWVGVSGGSVRGWVRSSEIIPIDQAIDHFSEEIRRNPNSAMAFVQRGLARYDKGDYVNAIFDYGDAIRIDPKDSDAFYNQGNAWRAFKQEDKAAADYYRAGQIDWKLAEEPLNLGYAKLLEEHYDEAIAYFDEAIRKGPYCADSYVLRAHAWHNKGEYDKAISDYNVAISIRGKWCGHRIPLIVGVALVLSDEGYDKAIADFDRALQYDYNQDARLYKYRGGAGLVKKKYDRAIADFDDGPSN